MALRIIHPDDVNEFQYNAVDEKVVENVKTILSDVKNCRDSALVDYSVKFGDLQNVDSNYLYGKEDMKKAYESLSDEDKELLHSTAKSIEAFAKMQMGTISEQDMEICGGRAGQVIAPMECAGCYAPGGRYPLPSSVLMTALTAKVAGVETIVVASPKPMPFTLAAAHVAGATRFIGAGGAQVGGLKRLGFIWKGFNGRG